MVIKIKTNQNYIYKRRAGSSFDWRGHPLLKVVATFPRSDLRANKSDCSWCRQTQPAKLVKLPLPLPVSY